MKTSDLHAGPPHKKTARQGTVARQRTKKVATVGYHNETARSTHSVDGATQEALRKEQKLDAKRRTARRSRPYPYREAGRRLHDLRKIFAIRYPDGQFPDDDAGHDDARLLLESWAAIRSARPDVIAEDIASRASWLTTERALALIDEARQKGVRHRAETLGNRLNLSREDRTRLGITTIRWAGCSDADMKASRRERDAARKRAARATQKALKPVKANLSASRPWEAEGISRRTWERRRSAADAVCVSPLDPLVANRVRTINIDTIAADAGCDTETDPCSEVDEKQSPVGGACGAPPPKQKENPMFKSVLRNLPQPLRPLVFIDVDGRVGIDEQADADAVEALAEFVGKALHHWRSVRGPSAAEREEALDLIASLIHEVDAVRFELYSRPPVFDAIEPVHVPAGTSIH